MASKPQVTRETVTAAVFAYFIEHGKACTRRELAAHSGLPYSSISKVYQEPGFWSEIDLTHVTVSIESRDYPGFVFQTRRVEAFLPNRSYMRKRFIEVSAS